VRSTVVFQQGRRSPQNALETFKKLSNLLESLPKMDLKLFFNNRVPTEQDISEFESWLIKNGVSSCSKTTLRFDAKYGFGAYATEPIKVCICFTLGL
jgi:hypothetical protein